MEENGIMMGFLSQSGWNAPEDPAEMSLMLSCFELFQTELPAMRQAIEQTVVGAVSMWSTSITSWEQGMLSADRIEQRKDLLACAMKKMVSSEYLLDAQRRWDAGEFSSVSEDFLVIGDLFVRRRGVSPARGRLVDKVEYDPDLPQARAGRKDITYQNWECGKLLTKATAVRPKINGERFVSLLEGDHKILRGFKDLHVKKDFPFNLVEYYAGKFFVLDPPLLQEVRVRIGNKEEIFLPHPWLTFDQAWEQKDTMMIHKYDGLILRVQDDKRFEEYRAKWLPTMEVDVQGTVWEVASVKRQILIRPRPGKVPVTAAVADSMIRSRLQGEFLFPFFPGAQGQKDDPLLISEGRVVGEKVGVKTFILFCPTEGPLQIGLIRDAGKPLDALGGHVEVGEVPIQAMLREAGEELKLSSGVRRKIELDPLQLAYHGVTQAEDYVSHVYSYIVMDDPRQYEGVELFTMMSFADWDRSTQGHPRQPWLSRHLMFLEEQYKNVITLFIAHEMIVQRLPLGAPPLSCICSSPEICWEKLQKHELAYGRKLGKLQEMYEKELGLMDLAAQKRVAENWPAEGFTVHWAKLKPTEKVEKYLPQEQGEIKKLVEKVFEFVGQKEISVADFNKSLIKLGYFFGTKTIKSFGRRIKSEGFVVEVFRPALVGGRGYRLPGEVVKVEVPVLSGSNRTVVLDNSSRIVSVENLSLVIKKTY